jgi:hypothetical protein
LHQPPAAAVLGDAAAAVDHDRAQAVPRISSRKRILSMDGLREHIRSGLAPEVLGRLLTLDKYDPSFLNNRLIEKTHGLIQPDQVEHAKRELKRFMSLALIFRGPIYPPTRIDACWHEFILYTREYREFCRDILGIAYFDHRPFAHENETDPATFWGMQDTIALYRSAYETPGFMWAPVSEAEQRLLLFRHTFGDVVPHNNRSSLIAGIVRHGVSFMRQRRPVT